MRYYFDGRLKKEFERTLRQGNQEELAINSKKTEWSSAKKAAQGVIYLLAQIFKYLRNIRQKVMT